MTGAVEIAMPEVLIEPERPQLRDSALAYVADAAESLPAPDSPAFAQAFDRFADARVLLLGAATEGTAEFHQARAAITRWLVERRGFNVVALAADWADVPNVGADRRASPTADPAPTPLWRSAEFETFLGWLTDHNRRVPEVDRAALHGLDVYGGAHAVHDAAKVLARLDPVSAPRVRERYGHPAPWARDALDDHTGISGRYARCEGAVISALKDSLRRRFAEHRLEDSVLAASHVARLLQNAEAYYAAQYYGGAEGWSGRSAHLFETLEAVLRARGPQARAVVWAHNALVGDASATEMGRIQGHHSFGELCRQRFGEAAVRIGFGTGAGSVACRDSVSGARQVLQLSPTLAGSHERLSHSVGQARFLLDLRPGVHSALRRALAQPRPQRFIGETYSPDQESALHYAACRLPEQFDAWVWLGETCAAAST